MAPIVAISGGQRCGFVSHRQEAWFGRVVPSHRAHEAVSTKRAAGMGAAMLRFHRVPSAWLVVSKDSHVSSINREARGPGGE